MPLQQLRGEIAETLASDFSEAERLALERILREHVEPFSSGWAERWRSRYSQQAVRPRPWSRSDVRRWGEELATAPRTGGELHLRVVAMIAELERELSTSDFDRRGLFHLAIRELDFRAWLEHALDGRRRSWFSIVQEAETARAGQTDLRIELRGTMAAVVVGEIKVLHRWTCGDSVDRFRTQLVDRYLLTPRTRHGIYLLVDLGLGPRGAMPDGSSPTGTALVELINEAAAGMRDEDGPIAIAQLLRVERTERAPRRHGRRAGGGVDSPRRDDPGRGPDALRRPRSGRRKMPADGEEAIGRGHHWGHIRAGSSEMAL